MTSSTATILIVDDEIQNRKLLEVLLRHEGYLTLSAANGEEAVASIAQRAPDLILLDIMMPGMDGYQVASILKANPATSNIPIIMVTAEIDRSARLTGLNAGAEEFLTKPVDGAELQLRVRNLLHLKAYGDFLQNHSRILEQQVQALQDRDTELKQALRELNEQATTAPLTGLHNRRYLMDFLQRELARAERSATPVAAIMLDLDHFKRINDTFGHAGGDLVLTEVAGLLKRHIRGSDMVCRYGGEEFVLILPGASLDDARQRAEKIRILVRSLDLKYHDQPLGTITASLGVALFRDHAEQAESLIHAADESLYEAKGAGRDRVIVSRSK